MARGPKKRLPKCNTVHQNALYAPQILPIPAIGACYGAGLPSETWFYDGSDGEANTRVEREERLQ